ncbi:hypothetical protein [Candidatus Palauibacter sp.]|uniref:amino acid kinase family protein n=1 Tax=Candidatus Palauibacter sp. TaxID=3101350 RepID=UPI003B0248DC
MATGEEASVALLALALESAQVRALGIPFWRVPVRTKGPLEAAEPVAVDARAIATALATHEAVVLPGFVGVDSTGATSLLGRGGSDLTARAEARRTAGGAVHERALRFAERHRVAFRVAAPGGTGTWIGKDDTREPAPGRERTVRCA